MANQNMMTLKEVAKLFGLSEASINHYVNMGLVEVSVRKGNQRFFEHNLIIQRMELIRNLQKKGYLLRQIRDEIMHKKAKLYMSK